MSDRDGSTSLAVLLLSGPFSLILLLVFSPTYLTALESGDALPVSPLAQTVVSIAWMAVASVLVMLGSGRLGTGAIRVASYACPFVAGVLAAFVHAPAVPLANALLLGTGCVCQLFLGARACRRADSRRMPVLVGVSLALAALLTFLAIALFEVEAYGAAMISFLSAACALGFVVCERRQAGDTATHDRPPVCEPLVVFSSLKYDWKPLAGGVVCAVSLGLSWNSPISSTLGGFETALLAGKLLGALVLCWVCFRRDRNLVARSFDYALALAACGSVAVWAVGGGDYVNLALLAVASAAQVMFIGMLWVETCYTARDLDSPEGLSLAGMAVFFCAYVVGGLLSAALSPSTIVLVVPALNLVFLLVFVTSLIRGGQASDEEGVPRRYDESYARIIDAMASDYALSTRESEVLPYLVLGVSSSTVAERLFVSPHTVKSHTARIYAKMNVHSHDELVDVFERYSHES